MEARAPHPDLSSLPQQGYMFLSQQPVTVQQLASLLTYLKEKGVNVSLLQWVQPASPNGKPWLKIGYTASAEEPALSRFFSG